jgi:hypothetical protein
MIPEVESQNNKMPIKRTWVIGLEKVNYIG